MKIRVVVPMAGRGSRYADRGWTRPKPFILVAGKPMFLWALESLRGLPVKEIIIVLLSEHDDEYHIRDLMKDAVGVPVRIVCIDDITEGQLCTVLAAKGFIDDEEGVLIASSDTLVVGNLLPAIEQTAGRPGGVISVINLPGNHWSFAKASPDGKVTEVAEKVRISDHASTGLYYFSSGRLLIKHAEAMISKNERTRGEYYVIPVYNKLILDGANVIISEASAVWDMGTPQAKKIFERNVELIQNQLNMSTRSS